MPRLPTSALQRIGLLLWALAIAVLAVQIPASAIEVVRDVSFNGTIAFTVSVAAAGVAWTWASRRWRPLSVAVGVMAIGGVARMAWIWWFDSYQVSDFGWYYYCGQQIASGRPELCGDALVWNRALFYTAPIALLADNSLTSVEIANLLMFLCASACFVGLGVQLYGARVASLAAIIFVAWPDYWYPMTLASHDNWAVLSLAAFFFCFFFVQRELATRIYVASASAVALGMTLALMKYTRSYELFGFATCIAVASCQSVSLLGWEAGSQTRRGRQLARIIVFIVVLPFLAYASTVAVVSGVFVAPTVNVQQRTMSPLGAITAVNVAGRDTYDEIAPWAVAKFPALEAQGRSDFAIRKLLNELTHDPLETVAHIGRKAALLSRGTGNFRFAARSEPSVDPDEIDISRGQVDRTNSIGGAQETWIEWFNLCVALLVLGRIVLMPVWRLAEAELPIVAFSGISVAGILLVGEVQPRYDIFLIFAFAYWSGAMLDATHMRPSPTQLARALRHGVVALLLVGLTFALIAVGVSRSSLAFEDLSTAEAMSRRELADVATVDTRAAMVGRVEARFNRIRLAYPSGEVAPSTLIGASYEMAHDGGVLECFLTLLPDEFRKYYKTDLVTLPWERLRLQYRVWVDEELVAHGAIKDFATSFLSIDLPSDRDVSVIRAVVVNGGGFSSSALAEDAVLSIEHVGLRSTD